MAEQTAVDMDKRVALVMGGSDGIGKEVARGLATAGVITIIVGRNQQKNEAVAKEISSNRPVEPLTADVSRMSDVRRVANHVLTKYDRLDYLVHSAGAIFAEKRVTEDGFDAGMAVNYLSRFLLTNLLKDRLASSHARVVIVGGAGMNGDVFFDDPYFASKPYSTFAAIKQVQQLNDVFSIEAQRRWGSTGVAFHTTMPGLVDTGVGREIPGWFGFFYNTLLWPFKRTAASAAVPHIRLLLEPFGSVGGRLWNGASEIKPAARVLDVEYGRRCWELSERLLGRQAKEN